MGLRYLTFLMFCGQQVAATNQVQHTVPPHPNYAACIVAKNKVVFSHRLFCQAYPQFELDEQALKSAHNHDAQAIQAYLLTLAANQETRENVHEEQFAHALPKALSQPLPLTPSAIFTRYFPLR
ncbi:MAG: hypothetical protein GW763_17070 [Paraglaciecola sp.]|nr:hypothetical protein [Paraglaciecola sp.]NCT49665.1 hypothetical protein [Paraglaciecola sp.]